MRKILVILIIGLFTACESEQESSRKKPSRTTSPEVVQHLEFNADSAYYFVKKQTEFGPRVPNTPPHEACRKWLVSKLDGYGMHVIQQSFEKRAYNNELLKLTNIIAEYNPQARKRILLAAHWDTRHIADRDTADSEKPIQGANDGASGVGVLLELARIIRNADLGIGVDFVLFDGEDYGQPDSDRQYPQMQDSWCLGAQYWSKNKHRERYYPEYGILLDMVGALNARFSKEGVSRHYASNVVEKIWKIAHQSGYSDYFQYRNSEQIVDDHTYVNRLAQIPMVDIIEHAPHTENGGYFGDYHHTHSDNIDIIDRKTLKAVGQTVANVLVRE